MVDEPGSYDNKTWPPYFEAVKKNDPDHFRMTLMCGIQCGAAAWHPDDIRQFAQHDDVMAVDSCACRALVSAFSGLTKRCIRH